MRSRILPMALALSLVLVALPSNASKKVPPLRESEVETTWIGLSEGGLYAYRLDLKANGKGLAAFTKKNSECAVFSISSWTYENGDIRIEGESLRIGEIVYSPLLIGEVIGSRMLLVDKGEDWKIRVELRRESEMLDLHARLQKAMAEAKIMGE